MSHWFYYYLSTLMVAIFKPVLLTLLLVNSFTIRYSLSFKGTQSHLLLLPQRPNILFILPQNIFVHSFQCKLDDFFTEGASDLLEATAINALTK